MSSIVIPKAENTPMKKSVRECVFDVMRAFGADTIFGNPGSTELPMFRDFPSDFRYVLGLQEAVVVSMADGYAQATGNVAVANLHSAAGVGNAMGNIHTAFKNRAPVVIIAGQQSRTILPFDPYLASDRATELPQPYVKWSVEPSRAEDVPHAVMTACLRALQEPCGPVLVSVPCDDWDRLAVQPLVRSVSRSCRPDPVALEHIAHALARSKKPAFVVGADVDRSGAWNELVELAEQQRAAVFAAPLSARAVFPETHPQFMGFLPAAREQIVESLSGYDVVFVVGAPIFTYHIEGSGPHAPHDAEVFQLTEDADAAARAPVGMAVVSGVKLAIQDLLTITPQAVDRHPPAPRIPPKEAQPSEVLTQAFVLQTLARMRNASDIVVEEAPTARIPMHDYLPILESGTFFTMASGGLGYGMPAAAGIAMAHPYRKVIAIIGDGSSMYSIQTLWTAAQFDLNVLFIVLNNQKYGAMKRFGRVLGFPIDAHLPGTDIPGLNFVSLAEGHGCKGVKISDIQQLSSSLKMALEHKGPFLLEIEVS